MTTTRQNRLTDADRSQVAGFLRDHGYASLDEWAEDNDYRQHPVSTEWYSLDDLRPFADPVDIEAACFRFIETEGEAQDERRYGFS